MTLRGSQAGLSVNFREQSKEESPPNQYKTSTTQYTPPG